MLFVGGKRVQPYCDSGLIVRLNPLNPAKNAGCQLPRRLIAAAAKVLLGFVSGSAVTHQHQRLLSLQGQLHTLGLMCLSCTKPGWR